ncbi:MAG: winged helix DNA-binding protein [Chloroflexi bacterium]|nr:winged helix DNA-binding protein [Chloroflexota bacterium]
MLARRSYVEIVHDILEMDSGPKTHIMYRTALTYPQAMRYIKDLSDRGLIAKGRNDSGREIYRVTPKGRELCRHIGLVMEYLGLGDCDV